MSKSQEKGSENASLDLIRSSPADAQEVKAGRDHLNWIKKEEEEEEEESGTTSTTRPIVAWPEDLKRKDSSAVI